MYFYISSMGVVCCSEEMWMSLFRIVLSCMVLWLLCMCECASHRIYDAAEHRSLCIIFCSRHMVPPPFKWAITMYIFNHASHLTILIIHLNLNRQSYCNPYIANIFLSPCKVSCKIDVHKRYCITKNTLYAKETEYSGPLATLLLEATANRQSNQMEQWTVGL